MHWFWGVGFLGVRVVAGRGRHSAASAAPALRPAAAWYLFMPQKRVMDGALGRCEDSVILTSLDGLGNKVVVDCPDAFTDEQPSTTGSD